MHGFLSRDGIDPSEFRSIARDQLKTYPNVTVDLVEVTRIRATDATFEFQTSSGRPQRARKILLATGVFDELPALRGIDPLFGVSVHPCPYCDGWEMQDRRIAVYGRGERGVEMARAMTAWVSALTLCTDGDRRLETAQLAELQANGIAVNTGKIVTLVAEGAQP